MGIPTSRNEFKETCLRYLGKPVIDINVSDEQIDDAIDYGLQFYADYHYDGSEKIYYKHQITSQDKTNKYFILPENIIGAVQVFPVGNSFTSSNDLFNIQYQIALNDLYTISSVELLPYIMMRDQLQLIQETLVGQKAIRYNRKNNFLYVDMDWNTTLEGSYLIVECYGVINPDDYIAVWKDRWLREYVSCLIEESWGRNLTKFSGMTLPGGVQFNGEAILSRAISKKQDLENSIIENYGGVLEGYLG